MTLALRLSVLALIISTSLFSQWTTKEEFTVDGFYRRAGGVEKSSKDELVVKQYHGDEPYIYLLINYIPSDWTQLIVRFDGVEGQYKMKRGLGNYDPERNKYTIYLHYLQETIKIEYLFYEEILQLLKANRYIAVRIERKYGDPKNLVFDLAGSSKAIDFVLDLD